MIRGLIWALILLPPLACAETAINIYGLSYHQDRDRDYNEVNPGIGIQHDLRETGRGAWMASAGIYRDSERNWATFAGAGYQFKLGKRVRAGLLLTMVKTDSYNSGDPLLVPLPLVSIDFGAFKLNGSIVPRSDSRTVGAIYLSIPIR